MPSHISSHHGYVNSRARRALLAGISVATMMLLVGSCSSAEKLESGLGEGTEPPSATVQTPESVATAEKEEPPTGEETPDELIPQPEQPDGIDGRDADAAIITAEYFLDVYEYAARNGDTDEYKTLFTDDCSFCLETLEDIDKTLRDELTVVTGGVERSSGEVEVGSIGDSPITVFFDLEQKRSVIVDSGGSVVTRHAAGKLDVGVRVVLLKDGWIVEAVSGKSK